MSAVPEIYEQDFRRADFNARAPAGIPGESPAYSTTHTERAAAARTQLAEAMAKRAKYNAYRYAVRAPAGRAAELLPGLAAAAHPTSWPQHAAGNPDETEADVVLDISRYLHERLRTDAIPAGPSHPRARAETKAQSPKPPCPS